MSDYKGNQKAVVEHEKGNILVSASAGSGKTYTMISRAIRLIKEGKTTVSNILALTFTESAALEMKEKLKKFVTVQSQAKFHKTGVKCLHF